MIIGESLFKRFQYECAEHLQAQRSAGSVAGGESDRIDNNCPGHIYNSVVTELLACNIDNFAVNAVESVLAGNVEYLAAEIFVHEDGAYCALTGSVVFGRPEMAVVGRTCVKAPGLPTGKVEFAESRGAAGLDGLDLIGILTAVETVYRIVFISGVADKRDRHDLFFFQFFSPTDMIIVGSLWGS